MCGQTGNTVTEEACFRTLFLESLCDNPELRAATNIEAFGSYASDLFSIRSE